MKNIFITGATGFVGSYILRNLINKGYQVRALKRKTSPMGLVNDIADKVEWIEGDLGNISILEEAMEGVDEVYHSAAIISFAPKDQHKMLKVNAEGTANIVNSALFKGVEKLLYVSSVAALGRKENHPHIREDAQWENSKFNSNYAISKFKGECEVWRGQEEGLKTAIINPSMILGAGFWNTGTGIFWENIWKGLRFYPTGIINMVDVRDVAQCAIELMEKNIFGERFILTTQSWTYKSFFEEIAKALGVNPPHIKVSDWGMQLAWRVEWLKSKILGSNPVLTQETATNANSSFYYHNDKIKKYLNYSFKDPMQTILETSKLFLESQQSHRNYAIFS